MKLITISAIAIALVLTACGGSKLDGTYGTDRLKSVLVLKPNGKAVYMGMSELDYEVEGKDVKLHSPQGVLILKGRDDGSLDFPFLGNLKKRPSQ